MKLLVMDGNSILNRAYYGIRPLTTREGLFTHAVYGFLTTMQRLVDEEQPDALCCTFDLAAPTFRHKEYADYKGQRKKMPEELAMQIPWTKQVLQAMNIPFYQQEGYEADDLIGTISRRCEEAGWDCVIATGDRDSLQLITEHTKVKLIISRMGQTTTRDMTPQTFFDEYGFTPPHLIDFKALMGDTSDNIPGVPGIGEKTAMGLIQQYETIEALYRAMPQVEAKPAALRHLEEGKESAFFSYHLVTILTDVPMEFHPEDALRQPFSPELYDLFLKLEFSKLIEKYGLRPEAAQPKPVTETVDYVQTVWTVTTEKEAEEMLAQWRKAEEVTVFALPDFSAVAVEWETGEHSGETANLLFHRYGGDYTALLKQLFSAEIRKVSHQVKDLIRHLLEENLPADGFVFDTALAGYLLDSTAGKYDLPHLFLRYCNAELMEPAFEEADAFSPLGDSTRAETALDCYCSAISAVKEQMLPSLEEQGSRELLENVELPLCRVLAEMEINGMRIDAAALKEYGESLGEASALLEKEIYAMAGETFNINSPKQLGEILFEKLQLPHGKKTKTGYSTNADVLEKLRFESPVVEKILRYRQLSKLKSTYADGLAKVIGADGRIHTNYQMTVTATGRLSSTEPNLQNIPTRTELGSELRRMFIPQEDWILVDADYSQVELRLLAHIADDEALKDAFLHGKDIHTATAAQVFRVSEEDVTPQQRRSAKAVNFGIVYGISAFSLAQDIGVPVNLAKGYMENYFATYSGVRRYMTDIVAKAKEDGYVETIWHRRRYLPELTATNFNLRAFGERVALNMPIQGTAADIMKMAMNRVFYRMKRENCQGRLLLQVHDELLVECPKEEEQKIKAILQEEMEAAADLSIPLLAEANSGMNWLETK